MQIPPIPDCEAARLFSLQKLELLDTPADEQFDRITRTAKRLFGVEICLISLVDRGRQWFKSKQGLDASETPREVSFCGHAILSSEVLVVPNALEDPRFCDNPLVIGGPEIRFYAGFPIYSPDGFAVGTLCLIDSKPREFSEEDRVNLRDLAEMVEDRMRPSPDTAIDKLTQLPNRLGFELIAKQILAISKRNGTKALLVFFELDSVIESESAENLLERFGEVLTLCFRKGDLVGHFGLGEFAVLMTGQNLEAYPIITRLSKTASIASVGSKVKMEWSVGVSSFEPEEREFSKVIAEAERRMRRDRRRRKEASARE